MLAPCAFATSSFSAEDATAVTFAPEHRTELYGGQADAAAGAEHHELSPGCNAAAERSTWYAVRCATPNAAAVLQAAHRPESG